MAAVGRLQAAARRVLAAKVVGELRRERATLEACATMLQCAVRRRAAVRHRLALAVLATRAQIAKLHSSARLVQTFFRFRRMMACRQRAASAICCNWRRRAARLKLRRVLKAIARVQACFVGCRVRARTYRRMGQMKEISQRLRAAHQAALADSRLWLCNRTNTALDTLLNSSNLGNVLRAISSLEMFSLISEVVCLRMVVEGAVPVLFKLLTTCNRSTPHQKIVSHVRRAQLSAVCVAA